MRVIRLATEKYINYTDGSRVHTPEYYYFSMMKSRVGAVNKGGMTAIHNRYNASATELMLNFDFFKVWCREQVGFNNMDDNNRRWQLDKDICSSGQSLYSEETCAFIPQELNAMFQPNRYNSRSVAAKNIPLGISLNDGIYSSSTGSHRSLDKAVNSYYKWRIDHLNNLMSKYTLDCKVTLNLNKHIENLKVEGYHFIGNI